MRILVNGRTSCSRTSQRESQLCSTFSVFKYLRYLDFIIRGVREGNRAELIVMFQSKHLENVNLEVEQRERGLY